MKDTSPKEELIISVCDTDLYPLREGFSAFRESIAKAFMPWVFERPTSSSFSAKLESFTIDSGSFGRTKMSPLIGSRDVSQISRSQEECLYANYVLAGRLHVEQGDKVSSAQPGDLIIYDSTIPLKHVKIGDAPFEDLAFSIPKSRIKREGKKLENTLVPAHAISASLAACLSYLSQPLSAAASDELRAIASACATLLPSAGVWNGESTPSRSKAFRYNFYETELLKFTDEQLADPGLSPRMAAEHFDISVRYVHKLFAMRGTTFNNYVRTKRLDRIRRDIHSLPQNHPIAILAYRWGFNDLSTFQKAFKKKFGCTPGQYRSKC